VASRTLRAAGGRLLLSLLQRPLWLLAIALDGAGIVLALFAFLAAPSDAGAARLAHLAASSLVLGALALVAIAAYVGPGKDAPWRCSHHGASP
jgi:hypothetical protein